jgi:3-hydroxybutyryl-CoA dehydrogenase
MSVNVVIAGEIPIVEELTQICAGAGHHVDTFLVKDLLAAAQSKPVLNSLAEKTDIIIDAYNESAETKRELMMALDAALPGAALLLTSALVTSATEAAAWTQGSGRVVGYGLLSPIDRGRVVEITAALQTDDEALIRAEEFWRNSGFDPVQVADGPGLVRARILCCLINEAVGALMEGVASAEDIDKAMKLGTNYPMGPLVWADHLGLDTVLGVMMGLQREWGEERYRPSPLLRRKVLAGHLGKKSGRGFYEYGAT